MAENRNGILAALLAQQYQQPQTGGVLNALANQPVTANRNMLIQALKAREGQFQRGIMATPWYSEFQQQYGEPPNLNDPDYDYRTAWREGVRPQRYEYDKGAYHWPSVAPSGAPLKSENHPTAWMEKFMQATGKDPLSLGITSPEMALRYFQP